MVLIPDENEKDLKDIPKNVLSSLKGIPVKWIDQVLDHALQVQPTPLGDAESEDDGSGAKEADPGDGRPIAH